MGDRALGSVLDAMKSSRLVGWVALLRQADQAPSERQAFVCAVEAAQRERAAS